MSGLPPPPQETQFEVGSPDAALFAERYDVDPYCLPVEPSAKPILYSKFASGIPTPLLPSAPLPRLPPPPPQAPEHNDRTLFMQYLGLTAMDSDVASPDRWSLMRSRESEDLRAKQQWLHSPAYFQYGDQVTSQDPEGGPQSARVPPAMAMATEDEDFPDEERFCQLVGWMLLEARSGRQDAAARLEAVRAHAGEFGDWVCRFHARHRFAFPFYQPQMFAMLGLLTATDRGTPDALRSLTEQLRSLHLRMQLFLRPEETLSDAMCGGGGGGGGDGGDSNEAAVARLVVDFTEQVCHDIQMTSATPSRWPAGGASDTATGADADDPVARRHRGRYARRRVAALTAALSCYASTTERRRRLILSHMRSLAAMVAAACPPASTEGDAEAMFGLYSCMISCFGSFVDPGACPLRRNPPAAPPAEAIETPTTGRDAAADDAVSEQSAVSASASVSDLVTSGLADSATATIPPATDSQAATPEPQLTTALQLIDRLERLIDASFLPNERVSATDFRTAYDELDRWLKTAATGDRAADKRAMARLAAIREEYQRAAQYRRADARSGKRLCTEAETAWDLVEAAKLMVAPASEERAAAFLASRTTAEWRDAAIGLAGSALARLYLFQVSQDPSALSMRLRADLQRLAERLGDCGQAAPLLALLRLRLCYLEARQFSDLLRPHPQGCLILELAQACRILRGGPAAANGAAAALTLAVTVPLCDYKKFCRHLNQRDLRVLAFEARAPCTDKNAQLLKASCIRKVEKCCQCTIKLGPAASASARPRVVTLRIRPDSSQGRPNAAMRMVSEAGELVQFGGFRLELALPPNYRPLAAFVDVSRPID